MAHRWYMVHVHSGSEKKVAQYINERAAKKGLSDFIEEVFIPVETFVEVKKGKKVNSERKFFPGYIMVKMDMNDDAWQLIKNTPKVTGFLGTNSSKPQPISDSEAENIFKQVEEGMESPRHTVQYEVGDSVKVVDGPFDSFVGVVEDMDEGRNKLKVAVSIFGRSTPVELDFTQVEKN